MRIIALPLTSAVRGQKHARASDTPEPLIYFHFQQQPPPKGRKANLLGRVTGKAAEVWAGFGQAPENTWKFKVFRYGERLVDRMDFEELALNGLDPSMGPKLSELTKSGDEEKPISIPLIHPKLLGTSPLAHIEKLVAKRTPRHRRGFYMWMLLAPLTTPFMIIPVVPNLPFFFCVWRSWSHYRAYQASGYLESLLREGAIVPHSNPRLDEIYAAHPPPLRSTAGEARGSPSHDPMPESETDPAHQSRPASGAAGGARASDGGDATAQVILAPDAVPPILSLFDLPPSAASDMHRAIEQAGVRLRRGAYK